MRGPVEWPNGAFRLFLDFWNGLPRDGAIPEFDPLRAMRRIPKLIPHLSLLEVRTPAAIVFRVASSAVRAHMGHEMTGRDLLSVTPADLRSVRYGRYRNVVDRPCGLLAHDRDAHRWGYFTQIDTLLLPVRRQGHDAAMLLAFTTDGGVLAAEQTDGWDVPLPTETDYVDLGFGVPAAEPEPVYCTQVSRSRSVGS
jgi:hypothetical protein